MAIGKAGATEREAMAIVLAHERAAGRFPSTLSKSRERELGCDILSYPDEAQLGEPDRIEVKGWGEPLRLPSGRFTYPVDLNAEQLEAAKTCPCWRLEIVANLAAALAGMGTPERKVVTAAQVVTGHYGWRYRVDLEE